MLSFITIFWLLLLGLGIFFMYKYWSKIVSWINPPIPAPTPPQVPVRVPEPTPIPAPTPAQVPPVPKK